jgi:hypothetical protein
MDDLTLDEKKGLLAELKKARYSGAKSVKYLDRQVEYKSDAEMVSAINALTAEINAASGKRRSNVRLTQFSSGF